MADPLDILKHLLVVVLALPLVAAGVVCVLGRIGRNPARRAAAGLALLHLALTSVVVFFAHDTLGNRAKIGADHFRPVFVPGDAGGAGSEMGNQHETNWVLLSVATPTSLLPAPDVQFFIGLDGINIWLVLLTSFLSLIAVWTSWDSVTERAGAYYGWLFLLETGVLGAFLAFDAILFYVFFELTLIPAFFLIGQWGTGPDRREAARRFFLYTLFGSLFTLIGLIGVVLMNPTPYAVVREDGRKMIAYEGGKPDAFGRIYEAKIDGPVTFSIPRLMRNVQTWSILLAERARRAEFEAKNAAKQLADARGKAATNPNDPKARQALEESRAAADLANAARAEAEAARDLRANIQTWLFFALIAGFAVKTPLVPFHTWLPSAYAAAPMAVTMYLSALLAKLGTFGMIRVVIPLLPDAAFQYGLPVIGFLAAVGIVYGALCAYAQRDAKLLVAYSSVSHLGLLLLGMFALNREGLSGAVLHMVNHGLTVGAMFALLGFLTLRYRTLDMNQYGGLLARFPAYSLIFFVIALAGIGLPGLNNFVSEMLLIGGLFDPVHTQSIGYEFAGVAAFGVFLSAWYVITMLRRIFFGPLREPQAVGTESPKDVTGREALAFGLPAVLCVVLGLFPQPVIHTILDGVEPVIASVNSSRIRAGYAPIPNPPVAELSTEPTRQVDD